MSAVSVVFASIAVMKAMGGRGGGDVWSGVVYIYCRLVTDVPSVGPSIERKFT
jgi:hypothetical protein